MSVGKFLVVSIDCWRYDALSRTNALFNTPKFDLLTRDYALAERYFVTAPATRPSHSSLFTGLYPFEHGLLGQTYLKMFAGIDNLFDAFTGAGYSVKGFSERADVFRFLDFEPHIGPVDDEVASQHLCSLERLATALIEPDDRPQFKFLHFWYTHGGYGLSGIPGLPNLRELVELGETEEALRYYYAAVNHVLEFSLVELLKKVNLDEWAVFICGDHGEGFCDEVMAHGDRLHPNVVHVPMLAHMPGGLSFPAGPVSAIDLFPTLTALAGIDTGYKGYGRSWLGGDESFTDRWVLSELDSLYGVGFLSANNLQLAHDRVTSRTAVDDNEIAKYDKGIREWCLCDGEYFYRENEQTAQFVLRDLNTGADLVCADPHDHRTRYGALLDDSAYKNMQGQETSTDEAAILEKRLRDLGYIE